MKILTCQMLSKVGALKENSQKISQYYAKGLEQKADIVLLPELALTGYSAKDLWLKPSFHKDVADIKEDLVKQTKETVLLLPTIFQEYDKLYNGIIAAQNGKIIDKASKLHLPNHNLFNESRYFDSGGLSVIEVAGVRVGIVICYDIWFKDTSEKLNKLGADIILVANASPYALTKRRMREQVARQRFSEFKKPIIYVNMVGTEDGVVFDGGSFWYDESLNMLSNDLREDDFLLEFNKKYSTIKPPKLPNLMNPSPSKYATLYGCLVGGTRGYIERNGFKKVIIGISGGIDSALTMAIAADSIGPENITAVMLPSKYSSFESMLDAEAVINKIGVKSYSHNIDKPVSFLADELGLNYLTAQADLPTQNLQSRIRGVILMAYANMENSLLLTTGNKSEYATGYATLYGDMNGAFNPIKDVYKTDVFELARWRNANIPEVIDSYCQTEGLIAENIITKAPSAELSASQKDSDDLPDYNRLDAVLRELIDNNLSSQEIIDKGFEPEEVRKIAKMFKRNEFKRQQSAPGVRVSNQMFDLDRKYPISNEYD